MADEKETTTARVFSAEVFGADMARALDAFAALEVCISADTLRSGGAVAAESVPFARPSGVSNDSPCTRRTRSRGASTTRTPAAW